MPVTELSLEYTEVCDKENVRTTALILCGGSSSRMKGADKIFTPIGGSPLVARTIMAFEKCERIQNIVIVIKEENLLKMQRLCDEYKFHKVTDIVAGGTCREESAAKGVAMLSDSADYVLVHDGARPFVSEACINRVIDGAVKYSAAACAVKVKDTIKQIRPDKIVISTPDRNTLVSVQTPQGFAVGLYKKALQTADRLDLFTDDCSLVENIGYPVYMVEGEYTNMKITTPDDLEYAQFLAGKEE